MVVAIIVGIAGFVAGVGVGWIWCSDSRVWREPALDITPAIARLRRSVPR